jgi:CheY-like chemotaxis protein
MIETLCDTGGIGCVSGKKRVVIVDDSENFCRAWREFFECRYGDRVRVEAYLDPVAALREVRPDIALLLVDLEMPVLDGKKFLEFAAARGVDRRRVVIVSARDADVLHEIFPMGACLAVINKEDPPQQEAFLMIIESLLRDPPASPQGPGSRGEP